MGDLNNHCEKCVKDMEQLRGEVAEAIALVKVTLSQVDDLLGKIEISNQQIFADLKAQTNAGFASLRACISEVGRSMRREDDEPPKLN